MQKIVVKIICMLHASQIIYFAIHVSTNNNIIFVNGCVHTVLCIKSKYAVTKLPMQQKMLLLHR